MYAGDAEMNLGIRGRGIGHNTTVVAAAVAGADVGGGGGWFGGVFQLCRSCVTMRSVRVCMRVVELRSGGRNLSAYGIDEN